MEGIEAFTLAPFTRALGWSVEEAQEIIAQVRSEWPKRSLHGYQKLWVFLEARMQWLILGNRVVLYGRKPIWCRDGKCTVCCGIFLGNQYWYILHRVHASVPSGNLWCLYRDIVSPRLPLSTNQKAQFPRGADFTTEGNTFGWWKRHICGDASSQVQLLFRTRSYFVSLVMNITENLHEPAWYQPGLVNQPSMHEAEVTHDQSSFQAHG